MKRHCPAGVVRDNCHCCVTCATGLKRPCNLTPCGLLPPCGTDLRCVRSQESTDLNTVAVRMKNWLFFVVSFCLVVICKGQVTWHQLGYEYYIYTGMEVNYSAAVNACTSMNATLARIKTKQVQAFLMEKIKLLNPGEVRKVFYIGLNRINSSSREFQWNDGMMLG
ncbi:uncharacterized protein LOC113475345 [Ciona intestinalis]